MTPGREAAPGYAVLVANDTTSEAHAVQTAIYQRMSPARRCEIAARMSVTARAIAVAGIRNRHPEYDDEQARMALFRLLLGDEAVSASMAARAGVRSVSVAEDSPEGLLRAIVDCLDTSSIPYMVVGSFASTFHGEPRTTHDLDIVID